MEANHLTEGVRPTAFVTGGSSGIGAGFARRLAREGFDLVLVARPEDEALLRDLCADLSKEHGISAQYLAADLSRPDGTTKAVRRLKLTTNLGMLVNCAGFGCPGRFHEKDIDILLDMIRVHDIATVRLTHAAIPNLAVRARLSQQAFSRSASASARRVELKEISAIINVSSATAFMMYAPSLIYNATKAFLNSFSRSLAFELRETGVRVQVLCPGFTRTRWHEKLGYSEDHPIYEKFKFMSPEEVVDCSLRYLLKNKVLCVPGLRNRLCAHVFSLMPSWLFCWCYNVFRNAGARYVKGWDAESA